MRNDELELNMDKTNSIEVSTADPFGAEAQALMAQLDEELLQRYPQSSIHGMTPDEARAQGGTFLIARLAGEAVGCGALRPLSDDIVEVKRMFVKAEARRGGIAKRILHGLEAAAQDFGFLKIKLETGTAQPESVAFYESLAYQRIPCYGEYADDPFSLCYEKLLL
jgi:GNAT superfamily N-acetyltransferase